MALLELVDLVKTFPVRGGFLDRVVRTVEAVRGVSLAVAREETVGIVGESGCGKSTLARTIVRLYPPDSGRVLFDGVDLTGLDGAQLLPYRRRIQMVFQDPYASLNPRYTVARALREVVRLHRVVPARETDTYIDELIARVGLRPEDRARFPHEFSGGQRQRVGIARALAVKPELLVADEPVSALDVSVQAQVLNLLRDLREELGLTILFIAHDLKVVEHFSDRVAVMYLGRIVEEIDAASVRAGARHPYTRALLAADPPDDPDDRKPFTVLGGEVPSAVRPPAGCAFRSRCPLAEKRCASQDPPLERRGERHRVACWAVE